ncbi:Putative ornithine cyclodeaminase, mu-crystallin [Corynebacterium camporealensis]|uniref:Putative ornithine cyclodeaminase, mu-crystallin n=1 Tax=Corynebacterium camporealensis TaxID=161896 RepID=A0A0F6TB09_9CORY|nr:ornithine cyclodeaminase [Corynebacterium camporealensis]AKE39096.1 putative ornithine cyclodeaminase, mu-crystallin [Corynebacterium camporealensis]AVH88319.1 Putative ornithine cyclodeaminase, mu-crystallin [Corynebacterium camporealensis]
MVSFVDVNNMVRWIQRDGVENIITGMVDYLEHDFRRWERFDKIARVASHTPFGVIELMPTSDGEEYSFKYVNGHPSNPARGFQTVTAFGVLADVDNGYPTFQAEMTLLTALRTAATSAMVAKHVARKDSKRMAMIGAGSQSEFQALGFRGVVGIEDITIYDVDPKAVEKFRRNMEPLGFNITVCSGVDEAVIGADIITTCTADKAQNQILATRHVAPGVHLNAVGGDCPGKTELEAEILDDAKVFVEFPPQTRVEGEIQQKPEDFPVVEFWKVLTGAETGRDSEEQVTLFDDVGFAINDFSALRYCRDAVKGTDLETQIDLVADPEDPKDLFSMTSDVPSLL